MRRRLFRLKADEEVGCNILAIEGQCIRKPALIIPPESSSNIVKDSTTKRRRIINNIKPRAYTTFVPLLLQTSRNTAIRQKNTLENAQIILRKHAMTRTSSEFRTFSITPRGYSPDSLSNTRRNNLKFMENIKKEQMQIRKRPNSRQILDEEDMDAHRRNKAMMMIEFLRIGKLY